MKATPLRDDRSRVWPNMLTYAQSTIESTPEAISTNGCTPSLDSSWVDQGIKSLKIVASNGTDTFVRFGGDLGGFRLGMQAGRTYRVCVTYRVTETNTSSPTGNGTLALTVWWTLPGPQHIKKTPMVQAPNTPGVYRLQDEFTVPANATAAWIRFYLGYTTGTMWIDRIGLFDTTTRPCPPDWWCPGTS